MTRFSKKLLFIVLLFGVVQMAFADRGIGKKNKNRATLNINTLPSLRNSIGFNLRSGLSYKGSLLSSQQTTGGVIMNNALITYQKGNTTYIIPYKHRIITPDIRQGYSGMKLTIRSSR